MKKRLSGEAAKWPSGQRLNYLTAQRPAVFYERYGQMKKMGNLLILLLTVVFIFGACTSEPEMDKSKFTKVDQIAQELQTSHAAGASYQHFGELLQALSAELAAVKAGKLSDKEMEELNAYFVLYGIYKDGYTLWKYKLEFAPFGIVPEGRIYVSQDVEPIAFKYNFPTESHLYRPTQQYWKSISEDSIQIVWNNADFQYKIIKAPAQ